MLGLLRRRLPRSRILLLALLPRDEAEAPRPREWPNMYTKVQMLHCSPRSCMSPIATLVSELWSHTCRQAVPLSPCLTVARGVACTGAGHRERQAAAVCKSALGGGHLPGLRRNILC